MKARKRFGQHFLEAAWADRLVEAIEPRSDDVFLEIGPGRGALTFRLARRGVRVAAVEIDRDLAAGLEATRPPGVSIVIGDFLDIELRTLLTPPDLPVRVVGNLPYNISSPILFRLLEQADRGRFIADATLMLQREVADRLTARPGTREYGTLAIFTQLHAEVTRLFTLPPGAFRPAPKVHSAVVRLVFRPPRVRVPDPRLFDAMVRTMFGQRRKTAANSLRRFAETRGLAAAAALAKAGVDPARRPETLELEELARLAHVFASAARPDVL